MKRYLAFHGPQYYPSEGMGDFIGDFATAEDALAAVLAKEQASSTPGDGPFSFTWGIVWDSDTQQNIHEMGL